MGLNSNVSVSGTQFHVQTEDLWPNSAQIVTHVFGEGGRVLRVLRIDYSQHLGKPSLPQLLPKVMKVHHASVLSKLSHQGYGDGTPETTLRSVPDGSAVDSEKILALGTTTPLGVDGSVAGRSGSEDAARDSDPGSGAFRIAPRTVWDRLVAEAQRERRTTGPTDDYEAPKLAAASTPRNARCDVDQPQPVRCSWDQAVESRRSGMMAPEASRVASSTLPDPAAEAYEAGLRLLRDSDKTRAFVCFARAAQLDPRNARYRATLRHALDWLDRREHSDRNWSQSG